MNKVLVTIKPVIDPQRGMRLKADALTVETHGVKHIMNPFDEVALEQGIRWVEQGIASELVVVSVGRSDHQDLLRQALALGAHRAVLVVTQQRWCCLSIAKILHHVIGLEKPDCVLMGKQSVDGDHNQTPQMLAELLHWPQVTFASHIDRDVDRVLVTRELDRGQERVEVTLPAVISVDLRLNTLRYVSLPLLMKAKQKPLTLLPLEQCDLSLRAHTQVIAMERVSHHRVMQRLDSVDALIDKLQQEVGVI